MFRTRARSAYHTYFRKPLIRSCAAAARHVPSRLAPFTLPPKREETSTRDWLLARGIAASRSSSVSDGDRLFITPPVSSSARSFLNAYLQNDMGHDRLAIDDAGRLYCRRPAKFVAVIDDGHAFAPDGAIVTSDRRILGDLSPEFASARLFPKQHSLMSHVRLPDPEHHPGRVAVLATLAATDYFGHWMMDLLPRIGLLQEAGFALDEVDAFYAPSPLHSYERESLIAAGLPLDRIINSREHPHIQAGQLIVPSPAQEVFAPSSFACDYVARLFPPRPDVVAPEGQSWPQRLLLTRRDANHRRLLNADEVEAELMELGFISLRLETLTLQQQAELFRHATFVVTVMGSVCANYVHCRRGTAILELHHPNGLQTVGAAFASERELLYGSLLGRAARVREAGLHDDIYVDVNRLISLIRDMEQANR